MLVDGEPPVIEIIDDVTIRYTWSKANPDFLPALAGASPLYIFRPAHYLKTVPFGLRRGRSAGGDGRRIRPARLGRDAQSRRQHVSQRQSVAADARTVGAHNRAAVRAVRVRTQPVLLPRRRDRPSAAVHRPGDRAGCRRQSDPRQGRRRRGDAGLSRPALRQLHLPQGRRGARQLPGPALAERHRFEDGALSESQRGRPGDAGAQPRRPLPARSVARHQPRRDQPGDLFRSRPADGKRAAAGKPALSARSTPTPGRPTIPTRPTRCSTRSGSPSAIRPARA